MSIVVVPLSDQWQLDGTEIGLLLATGPIGMAVGAPFLSPIAYRRSVRQTTDSIVDVDLGGRWHDSISICGAALAGRDYETVGRSGHGCCGAFTGRGDQRIHPDEKESSAIGIITIGNPLGAAG